MVYAVNKDIPIPSTTDNKFPFDTMEIGDSFDINLQNSDLDLMKKEISRLRVHINYEKNKFIKNSDNEDFSVTTRHVVSEHVLRVWRKS